MFKFWKRALALCLCVVAAFVFCGCVAHSPSKYVNDYSVRVCDFTDSGSGATHAIEFSYWSDGYFEDPNAKSALTMSVNGEKIRGEYYNSYKKFSDNYVTDFYCTAGGDRFGVDPNGKLVFFFAEEKENANILLTEKEAFVTAKLFVEQYTDVEEYDYEIKRDTITDGYIVNFVRYINGYKTADSASVCIGENGQLLTFSTNMLGRFAGVSAYPFDYDRVEAAVYQKTEKIYETIKDKVFSIEHEIADIKYTFLENEDVVLIVRVRTHIQECLGEDIVLEHTEGTIFVVNI